MSLSRPGINSIKSSGSSTWGDPSRRPPSPTLSTTTTGSKIDFSHPPHLLITRADLRNSISALTELMTHAKQYRQCLLNLSKATSAFAGALEVCSRVKGCDTANAGILGASGLEYLIGNHEQLLADNFYREFEIPLLHLLDNYKASVTDRQAAYEKACQERSNLIRKTEHENMKHGRRRKRDLQAFRLALTTLQSLVDDLDHLKSSYHHEVMEAEDELWNGVLEKMAFVARAKMDLHDKVSSKSRDPSLEPLLRPLSNGFKSHDGISLEDGKILNTLAPLGLMSTPKSPQPALSRTPDRLQTPPSRELGGIPISQSSLSAVSDQYDRLPKGESGRNDTSTDAERSNTTANRRSFFGRLFKPSTDNLRTSGVGKPVPAPSMGRHGRHHSQQSIASTAETYTEDSEVDDAADNQGDARRRERDRRVLMGRAVPHKRDNAHNPVETKGVPRVHVHAPIPNPRRTVSGSSVEGRQGRDKRELSVIEDEDVEECGDATVDGEDIVERTPGDGAVQDLKPEVGEKTNLAGSTITTPVLEDSPISVPPSLPPDDTQDENEADSPFKPTKSETALPTSAADPDVFVAQTQPPIDDSTRGDEEDREMLTAPPSPSVDHELQTIRDSTRREGKV